MILDRCSFFILDFFKIFSIRQHFIYKHYHPSGSNGIAYACDAEMGRKDIRQCNPYDDLYEGSKKCYAQLADPSE